MKTSSSTIGRTRRTFTLMETLVATVIFIILLSIFIPYALSKRELSRRARCETNLYQISMALTSYAGDNGKNLPRVRYDAENPDGYTAFSGADDPNPYAPDSSVQPNDVTASLWLLVRGKYIEDTSVFICPSSNGTRDWLTDSKGQRVDVTRRGNFRAPKNLSYSYASPFSSAPNYRLNTDFLKGDFAIVADLNPGQEAAEKSFGAPPSELSRGNSPNHGKAGQKVLTPNNVVRFHMTPYCGVGFEQPPGDNIYTARAAHPTTQATSLPAGVTGLISRRVSPVGNDDSYLVPTAEDTVPPAVIRSTTVPATSAPATSNSQ